MTTAAYSGNVKYSSIASSTTFTDEATSQIGTTDKYQIDDTTKNIWDSSVNITVEDDDGEISTSNIEEINYLFGYVRFASGFSPTGTVVVDGKYLTTTTELDGAHEFSVNLSNENLDTTTFKTATTNSGGKSNIYGLKDASITSTLYFSDTELDFLTDFIDAEPLLIEWGSGHSTETHTWRAFVLVESNELSGGVDGVEDESVTLSLVERTIPSGAVSGISYVNSISLMCQ